MIRERKRDKETMVCSGTDKRTNNESKNFYLSCLGSKTELLTNIINVKLTFNQISDLQDVTITEPLLLRGVTMGAGKINTENAEFPRQHRGSSCIQLIRRVTLGAGQPYSPIDRLL
jgi:hypothetical protein